MKNPTATNTSFAKLAGFDLHNLTAEAEEILQLVGLYGTIVGGAAVVYYVGPKARDVSPDLDMLVSESSIAHVREVLGKHEYVEQPNMFGVSFIHPKREDLSLDCLMVENEFQKFVVKDPVCLSPYVSAIRELDLFVMKALSGRISEGKNDLKDAKLLLDHLDSRSKLDPNSFDRYNALLSREDKEEVISTYFWLSSEKLSNSPINTSQA
jgi:hypothetical protein